MNNYYFIKFINDIPVEISQLIESEEMPELEEGWDVVWTEQMWLDYIASIPEPFIITPETATSVEQFYDINIDNYESYRMYLLAIVMALGNDNEEDGFNELNETEQIFVAKNGIGTVAQIASVLAEPTKDSIAFLISKQAFK